MLIIYLQKCVLNKILVVEDMINYYCLSKYFFCFRMNNSFSSTVASLAVTAASVALNASITKGAETIGDVATAAPEVTAPVPVTNIFLQGKLCQAIAGFFVWAALFLTCQQVNMFINFSG